MVWTTLRQNFGYDRYANRLWLDWLVAHRFPEDETAIFQHILGAQVVWADRCNGVSIAAMPTPEPTAPIIEANYDSWMLLMTGRTDDVEIDYHRFNGEAQTRTLSEIARHVVNHGTYHRGQMRGLCQAKKVDDFPETDLISYFFTLD